MPPPIVNFEGVDNRNFVLPPDTEGDIGPNHYMQWVNLSFAVYNRTGGLVYGPADGNTLFTGLPACGSAFGNGGDPIVLYDQFAGRWLASQLAYPNLPNGPVYQCVAVSSTDDPTGTWCRYEIQAFATRLNDYPKFGVWPTQNAYFLAVNQFDLPSFTFVGQGIFALNRDRMLACQTAQVLYKDMFPVDPNLGGMLPADVDGSTLPPSGAPGVFIEVDDDGAGFPQDQLDVWNATADWNALTLTMTRAVSLATAPFDSNLCGFAQCIPQPGTSQRLETLSDRLMYRLAYRNFGDHEALVVDHSVDTDGADHAGIRWYELNKTTGNWSIAQQGTYAPADGLHRWMGSTAMDNDGNLAIGFSTGNGTAPNYPSIAYAGRLATDPPGQLSQGEATLIAGTGSQLAGRWGDYSMLAIDPVDDCTFWYTSEYLTTTGGAPWQTRVGSFRFPTCTGGPPPPPPPPPPPLPTATTAAASATSATTTASATTSAAAAASATSAAATSVAACRTCSGSGWRRRERDFARGDARWARCAGPARGPRFAAA